TGSPTLEQQVSRQDVPVYTGAISMWTPGLHSAGVVRNLREDVSATPAAPAEPPKRRG
ncbi:hypothetical protein V490_00462, partial [Pseudogymnoascus sp. VKM F-3557]